MAYEFYNANSRDKIQSDCFIRALSKATNRSWNYTYDMISDIAKFDGSTMDNGDFIRRYLDIRFRRMPRFYGTIGEASDYYKDNVILITTKGHIVCSKYGTLYDSWDSSGREVEFIWLIS